MIYPADMSSYSGVVKVPGGGEEALRMVQNLSTEDFIKASNTDDNLCVDLARLVKIVNEKESNLATLVFAIGKEDTDVTLVCDDGQPFFVFCSGWSSLSPSFTKDRYSLSCKVLSVGDICLVLRARKGKERSEAVNRDLDTASEMVVDDDELPIDLTVKNNAEET